MRVMIAGGGTGGHTSPATAVIEELRRIAPSLDVEWVGRRGNIEERVARSLNIPFRPIPVQGWPRTRSLRKLLVAGKLAWSGVQCWRYLRRFRPDVVFGVGGYVSLPLLWVAQRCGMPTALHEQNRLLGMANRMLAPRADKVFLTYPDTVRLPANARTRVVGNPVRAGFKTPPSAAEGRAAFDLAANRPTVLVCGGSQGARSINEAMAGALPAFGKDEAQFIWMTGTSGVKAARAAAQSANARAVVYPFIDDMPAACAAADLIISRAGASTAAEITVMGKPSILVPYPHATDNHQEQNARALEQGGAAIVLLDDACTADTLVTHIRDLLADPARLAAMAAAAKTLATPDAARAIAETLCSLCK